MAQNTFIQVLLLLYFKELKRMWRSKFLILQEIVFPIMMVSMIIAVFEVPGRAGELSQSAPVSWRHATFNFDGDGTPDTSRLFYAGTGFNSGELEAVVQHLYLNDTNAFVESATRFDSKNAMQDALFKAGQVGAQADFVLYLEKRDREVVYDLQSALPIKHVTEAGVPYVSANTASKGWDANTAGIIDFQVLLAEGLAGKQQRDVLLPLLQRYPAAPWDTSTPKERYTMARKSSSWSALAPVWWGSGMLMAVVAPLLLMVRDKEHHLYDSLQALGVKGSAYRMSHALRSILLTASASLIALGVYKAIHVFYLSSLGLLFAFHAVYAFSCASFTGFLAFFIPRARLAPPIAFLLHGAGLALGAAVTSGPASHSTRLLACFYPPTSIVVFIGAVFQLENDKDGLNARTFWEATGGYPAVWEMVFVCLLTALGFLAATTFMEEGKAFLCACKLPRPSLGVTEESRLLQPLKRGMSPLLSARGLVKRFPGVLAVNKVDLDLQKGEVLSLLGHNGAGKSVTISLLTGTTKPDEGDMWFDGRQNDFVGLHKVLGVCPQRDIIFDGLTAHDHLVLAGALKGVSLFSLSRLAMDALVEIGIPEKATAFPARLSGGQKRKVAVAMAFLGGPEVVLLDEPTSGMDPASRRRLWGVIEKKKRETGCGIILTTHFMDEADILGDTITVMRRGVVQDRGSSLELKKKHGDGYSLIVAVSLLNAEESFSMIRAVVNRAIPGAGDQILSKRGGEIVFQVKDNPALPELLDTLSSQKHDLGIVSFGLSMTTLEDVFLKLETAAEHEDIASQQHASERVVRAAEAVIETPSSDVPCHEAAFALLYKRFCCARRDVAGLLFSFLLPFIFICTGIIGREVVNKTPSASHTVGLDATDVVPDGLLFGALDTAAEDVLREQVTPYLPDGAAASFLLGADLLEAVSVGGSLPSSAAVNVTSDVAAILLWNASAYYSLPAATQVWAFSRFPEAASSVVGSLSSMPGDPFAAAMTADMLLVFAVSVSLPLIPASFSSFIVRERMTGSRSLQLASGVSKLLYWSTTFLFDSIWTVVSMSTCTVLLTSAFSGELLWWFFLTSLLYGVVVTVLAYVASFFFAEDGKSQAVIAGWMVGLCFSFVTADLSVMASTGPSSGASKILPKIFAPINPTYGICRCLMISMNVMGIRTFLEQEYNATDLTDYHLLGMYHQIFGLQLAGYLLLLWLLETPWGRWAALARHAAGSKMLTDTELSPDAERPELNDSLGKHHGVAREKAQALRGGAFAALPPSVSVVGIAKEFKTTLAVRNLYLTIDKACCFGLLGVNGAGKTTLIRMLTCEVVPTSGSASISGLSVLSAASQVRRRIGLCPQMDAHLPEMTGRETLRMFCQLKGVYSEDGVTGLIHLVGLEAHADRPCGTYSGGNKRKLSVAIALIGRPDVVFLDEPSTGVDPKARRQLWDVIKAVAERRTVVLTSHSMEEVDSLATKVGIMKGGSLETVGTPQELRDVLSCGYTIRLLLANPEAADAVVEKLTARLPGLVVSEFYRCHIVLTAPTEHTASAILRVLQELSPHCPSITEYAVSQTTLEQVFLNAVRDDSN